MWHLVHSYWPGWLFLHTVFKDNQKQLLLPGRPRSVFSVLLRGFDNFTAPYHTTGVSPVAQLVKNLPAMQETLVQFLCWEDPLEEGMATHSSILAWRIPWTEEPGGPQYIGSQRIRHDWATKQSASYYRPQKSCLSWHFIQHHIYQCIDDIVQIGPVEQKIAIILDVLE